MPKIPTEEKGQLSSEELFEKANTFLELDEQMKKAKKLADPLKEVLKAEVTNFPTEVEEEKGHHRIVVSSAGKTIILQNTCKMSSGLVPSALDTLKETLTPAQLKKVVEKIEVVRDDVLEEMVKANEIPLEVVERIYTTTETFAFSAKRG